MRECPSYKTIRVTAYNSDEALREAVTTAPNEVFGSGDDPTYTPSGGVWSRGTTKEKN